MDHSGDLRSRGCQGVNEETGDVCGETSTLRILDEFRKLYEDRIRKISEGTDGSSDHTKLKIMEEWVKDLGEQNAMLVRTVEELEYEASNRVILLQEKLQQSADTVANINRRSMGEDESMAMLESRVSQLQKDEETLQHKIEFLQSDIRGLLELIRRARRENCWSLDGITFFEIQPSDIPSPLDCTCGQEKEDTAEYIASLKEQVDQLKETEKQAIEYQAGLEEKLAEQNKQVVLKEETIKNYIFKLQTLRDNLKNRSKLANQIILGSTSPSFDLDSDIVIMADIMENALNTNELEIENLRQQLQESETNFAKLMHEKSVEMDNLQSQLDQKCMELQQAEYRMTRLQKESLENRDALTVEVAEKHDLVIALRKELAMLEEQCRQSDMQTHFKDDIIKEMRRELKQAKSKETGSSPRRVRIKADTSPESDETSMRERLHETQNRLKIVKNTLLQRTDEINTLRNDLNRQKIKTTELCKELDKLRRTKSCKNQEDDTIDGNPSSHDESEILVHLSNTKVLMEKEREALLGLKTELMRMLEDISIKETEATCCGSANTLLNGLEAVLKHLSNNLKMTKKCACLDDKEKIQMKNLKKRVVNSVEGISKIYKDKEKSISLMKTAAKKCKDDYVSAKASSVVSNEIVQHFRMMEEFRICTVEAQAATEDLREEMTNVICSLNCRHEKFTELTKLVKQIQDHLTKTRENLSDTINQLKLQEQEKVRHSERITNGAIKLKDMKNEMNQMKSHISRCISSTNDNLQECNSIGIVQIHTCDDLLNMVNEEIQQIITNVQTYQTGACDAVTVFLEVKGQLNRLEDCLRDLQKKADEVLIDNEMAQNVFLERSEKLDRLEQELDNTHTKMQDMLENFSAVLEQICTGNSGISADENDSNHCSQYILSKSKQEDLFKMKEELRRVQKEYDDLRIKTSLEICQAQKQEKINEWKCRVADLQDQIRELQNEAKCEAASNEFLNKKIETMEKEISALELKAQTQRRHVFSDNAELKSRIFELECAAKRNKEKEDVLRKDLDCSEIELQKSKDLLGSHNIPQSFKVLQDTMQLARCGLEEIGNELKKLVGEGSSHSSLSSDSFAAAMDMLRKYGETTEQCSAEVERLRNNLCSKEKLLENKEEIIRIQKDSIKMTQAELKDLHQKLQEKDQHKEKVLEDLQLLQSEVQLQSKAIIELEKERAHLEKENELQVQTIGNLQEAVVEAKRRLDQMGNRAASELNDKDEAIQLLTIYLNETQYQYSQCFEEAAKQDTVLEFQREAVDQLRQKIKHMDNSLIVNNLHCVYFAILSAIQEQLQDRCKEFEAVKAKMEAVVKSKNNLEEKYANMKRLWQEADQELRELKSILLKKENDVKCCQAELNKCKLDMKEKDCAIQELTCKLTSEEKSMKEIEGSHCVKVKDYEDLLKRSANIENQLRNKIFVLTERNKDMKQQLQKYKMDLEIFDEELKSERKANVDIQRLQNENEILKEELGAHTRETETVINELQALKDNAIRLKEEVAEKQRVKSVVVKDELQKCNCDLVKLSTEAKVKEDELKLLKEFKKELERTQELESIIEDLNRTIKNLEEENKNSETKHMKCSETVARLHDDVDLKNHKIEELCHQLKHSEKEHSCIIQHLEEQLQLSEDRREECLGELNVSKEMLAVLRDRICSLKGILQEKSDDLVKLQADHQIIKNANSILKAEQGIFENKAREDISELKKRLKGVQIQLSLMEDNYHRVTQDFNKSQDLLVAATKREVDLQHAITSMENNLLSKLSIADREESRLGDMVDKLSEELEDVRTELSSKNSQLCQAQCRNKCYVNQLESLQQECQEHRDTVDALRNTIDKLELKFNEMIRSKETEETHFKTQIDNQTTCNIGDGVNKRLGNELTKVQAELRAKACKESAMQCEIQSLQEKLLKAEEVKCCLSTQLQQCLQENCDLAMKKSILEQNNCKCVSELEDMHKSLLDLRQECQVKTKSLVSMSAELSQVAVSRSELCTESQYVVLCIRAWMEEQKNLVETLTSKLNVKQQQVMQLAFEKKALLATIRDLRRANCALTQRIKRLHKTSVCSRGTRSLYSGCRTSPPLISNFPNCRSGPSSCSYSRLGKKSSLGPIRNPRKTVVCGHSWWFPKMEHLTEELRKNNQWWNKNAIDRAGSDPGLDESRDCGYQSSTSK